MTLYFNPETNEYPRYDGDIQSLYPEWESGTPVPTPWVEVQEVTEPEAQVEVMTYEGLPQLISGVWKMNWESRPMTEDEKARTSTPVPRDGLLYVWDSETRTWVESMER